MERKFLSGIQDIVTYILFGTSAIIVLVLDGCEQVHLEDLQRESERTTKSKSLVLRSFVNLPTYPSPSTTTGLQLLLDYKCISSMSNVPCQTMTR